MWNTITRITSIKRLASVGVGSALIAIGLLAGALTSQAAASEPAWAQLDLQPQSSPAPTS